MKKKILLVDDDKTFTQVVCFNLEGTGRFEVRVENTGGRGLSVAKEYKPDLILLDLMIPDMSGDKIAHQLKHSKDTRSIPIILLTAIITKKETNDHDNILGNYTVLAKPIEIDKLISAIDKSIK